MIGRFYNGRDHVTVCHGVQRIEALSESDPEVDALLCELKQQLIEQTERMQGQHINPMWVPDRRFQLSHPDLEQLANRIADRFAEKNERPARGILRKRDKWKKNSSLKRPQRPGP